MERRTGGVDGHDWARSTPQREFHSTLVGRLRVAKESVVLRYQGSAGGARSGGLKENTAEAVREPPAVSVTAPAASAFRPGHCEFEREHRLSVGAALADFQGERRLEIGCLRPEGLCWVSMDSQKRRRASRSRSRSRCVDL